MCPKCVLICGEMMAKPAPSSAEPAAEASRAAETSRARSWRRGSSPMSTVPRPSMPIVPSRVMAEIPADPYPTARWENRRAARAQYTKPSTDASPVVATRLPALPSTSQCRRTVAGAPGLAVCCRRVLGSWGDGWPGMAGRGMVMSGTCTSVIPGSCPGRR